MNKKLYLLIVEDSEDDALLVTRELTKGGYDIVSERVETAEDMREALKREWDIIIADYYLPVFSGLEALNILKETNIDLPFIIVSGKIGEDAAVNATKAGAHDYILKDNLKRLVPAVEREIRDAVLRREKKLAEQIMREQAGILDSLFKYTLTPMALINKETSFVRINEAYAEAFACSLGSCPMQEHINIYPPKIQDIFRSIFRTNKSYKAEADIFDIPAIPGMSKRYWNWTITPVTGPEGNVEFAVLSLDEVTGRKLAENGLKKANETLEVRAAKLRALASELTMSEQKERTRIAKILHDNLQQLLVSAKMRISYMNKTDSAGQAAVIKQVEDLLNESIRLSRSLTSDLCPPVLYETGLELGLEWLVRWMASQHDFKVILDIGKKVPAMEEDVRILLFESIRELLFNAAKHSGVDSAKIAVKDTDDRLLRITVADKGKGFDPAAVTQFGGTDNGFGLFSIKERLEIIGGSLEIDSAPGRESLITITAPLKTKETPVVRPQEKAEEQGREINTEKSEVIRVLLADDHSVVRQALGHMLSMESDIEIAGEAENGEEAIAKSKTLHPDVILMDIGMPVLDGIAATRVIHREHPEICIIGLSMHEEGELSQSIRREGAAGYITKSEPKENLIKAIHNCLAEIRAKGNQ